ncbi:MAG TPA: CheR family methyltransferase, partial [Polymorphobacter sp.]|nr:CheR family methyltransferase [Polymorphobacter sp.]
MPRSAMATGMVDMVLDVAAMPAALAKYSRRIGLAATPAGAEPAGAARWLNEIIELVRAKTAHDFSLYKPGTLQRRTERRLAMAAIEPDGIDRYIELLKHDVNELEALSKDLLINVTSFFRDAKVFDELEHKIIPALINSKAAGETLRVWIAGCSSGEETYSLAMLLREAIVAAHRDIKLQIFASDLDLDSVNQARDGLYPEAAVADITPARLKRFFAREDHGYRIVPELRNAVVFTRQDVLGDPPFSRLDLISCRNLLIYLQPEAQARVIAIFHFALRDGGVLLLGSAETVSNSDGRFAVISKAGRIFRKLGDSNGASLPLGSIGGAQAQRSRAPHKSPRAAALAELCRQLVVDNHAPAVVLVNMRHECLFHLGPTDRFLRIAPGTPANDVLAMARDGVRTKLRSAIGLAQEKQARVEVGGGHLLHGGVRTGFRIVAQPVTSDGEALVFVAFVDDDVPAARRHPVPARDQSRVAELEAELAETREELHGAIRSLEQSGEEQRAINEEALSVSEEFQATNEEMLASKEELQSLNEELTALNSQLQETLERQRTTSNDLQNVLFSTDVATLFLDPDLSIRFFTPATKLLFSVIDGDVGRPLSDLSSLAADSLLPADARAVLKFETPIEREIEARSGAWYMRRIMPYRAQDASVEGVVITFVDITERREISEALEAAKRVAQLATIAKSRFLAAASHDLRQPLQTLTLLHGLLARVVTGTQATRLVARLDETLGAMSGMLNALLDINRIEAGNVQAEKLAFPINDMLDRMRAEFGYTARAKGIDLRVVPSALQVFSDPALLDQMVRNLISNALKYTQRGKVLVGCRRSHGEIRIEIWDTGIGIPEAEQQAIFEEYHQLDNEARERSRGLGLGLSIVKRLGILLGHKVSVRSSAGS